MPVIRLIQEQLINYAGIKDRTITFGNVTNLSGKNGEGKSSIGGAPIWILFGKDLYGNDYTKDKYSPRPSNYKYDRVYASILLSIDGTEYKFAREIDEKKKNNFYVNDIPKSATDFSAAVVALITQDEFMSLYFPAYFFGLKWTEQRELLMKGATAPLTKAVLKEIEKLYADKLEPLLKKNSLSDLESKHKQDKTRLEKAHTEAGGATKKLREMLERMPAVEGELTELETQAEALRVEIAKEDAIVAAAWQTNTSYRELESALFYTQHEVDSSKAAWPALKDEAINDTCRTCAQPLQEDAIKAVIADKEKRIAAYRSKHSNLQSIRDEAKAALAAAKWVDVTERQANVRALEDQRDLITEKIRAHKDRARFEVELQQSEETEATTLISLRESTLILDAIKAYKAKEAELQAAEIQSNFTRLSVRLFKYVKSNDAYEPDFSIQMDGKDYAFLSTGEKIAAGLELAEVLHKQSGIIAPVFIDNVGEYTGPITAYDQVITGRAVPEQTLQIEVDGVIQ
ncbi:hypothetical protein [Paenibacillus sp. JDR-2]|uniref:hypothetical protein n=1 Tax=Paenibacillus sp. (strain JDR-2) TaxID=324057 RepID=UPI000166A4FF|nr:hypothetical protein [Paenibacillus sp. JDR-2]ACT00255.1 hypothetical protein Pjdr2_1585 [Paenibacillus sp. JDR-2]